MIKNKLSYCTLEEMENNINILLIDEETMNIFLDGKETPDMSDTIRLIYEQLEINVPLYKEYMWMQAIDFLDSIVQYTPLKQIKKFNLIIKNASDHHNKWRYNGNDYSFQDTISFYRFLLKRFEVEGSYMGAGNISFDVYLCDEDLDFQKFNECVNFPDKHTVERKMNVDIKMYER